MILGVLVYYNICMELQKKKQSVDCCPSQMVGSNWISYSQFAFKEDIVL